MGAADVLLACSFRRARHPEVEAFPEELFEAAMRSFHVFGSFSLAFIALAFLPTFVFAAFAVAICV